MVETGWKVFYVASYAWDGRVHAGILCVHRLFSALLFRIVYFKYTSGDLSATGDS